MAILQYYFPGIRLQRCVVLGFSLLKSRTFLLYRTGPTKISVHSKSGRNINKIQTKQENAGFVFPCGQEQWSSFDQ